MIYTEDRCFPAAIVSRPLMVYYLIKPEEYFKVKTAKYSVLRFFFFFVPSVLNTQSRGVE
jgi:hypothetical protein